ncbi:MAG TPA: hypothetical protein VGG68_01050 [Caulobacteraceae bacterium]|jgi:hypothetical protein
MNRKTAMLMGAAAALTAGPALAQPAQAPAEPAVPAASSYADLLQPIPNAVERLEIADMQEEAAPVPRLIQAQYYQQQHHHHHHHHNRQWYSSHGYVYLNGAWVLRPHHHHHHHNSYPPHY